MIFDSFVLVFRRVTIQKADRFDLLGWKGNLQSRGQWHDELLRVAIELQHLGVHETWDGGQREGYRQWVPNRLGLWGEMLNWDLTRNHAFTCLYHKKPCFLQSCAPSYQVLGAYHSRSASLRNSCENFRARLNEKCSPSSSVTFHEFWKRHCWYPVPLWKWDQNIEVPFLAPSSFASSESPQLSVP